VLKKKNTKVIFKDIIGLFPQKVINCRNILNRKIKRAMGELLFGSPHPHLGFLLKQELKFYLH